MVRRRRGHGRGRFQAWVAFLLIMVCLGGLANVAPIPHALIGLAAVVAALICFVGSGPRRRRH